MKNVGAGDMLIKMYLIENREIKIVEAKGLRRYLGLMFQVNPCVLYFKFKEPVSTPIHSMFCRKFFAIWLDKKNNIIEIKLIKPFRFEIKPKKKVL